MPSRRDLIRMTDEEVASFLAEPHNMAVATRGPGDDIHVVAMWYGFVGSDVAFWTYSKSQKMLNLQRTGTLTALVEAGESYDTLRGVELVADAEIITDTAQVYEIGNSIYGRYGGVAQSEEAKQVFLSSAPKRYGVIIHPRKVVSWDHRKLGGVY